VTPTQRDLLQKAKDSLDASELLLRNGYPDFAASRDYYSMFYVAEALLLERALSFSKHSAVVATFGREFCKSDQKAARFHRYLIEAMSFRHAGDYSPRPSVSPIQASEQIERASEILNYGEERLSKPMDRSHPRE